jgi:hypothetical protein
MKKQAGEPAFSIFGSACAYAQAALMRCDLASSATFP